jgi:hypothetical protein
MHDVRGVLFGLYCHCILVESVCKYYVGLLYDGHVADRFIGPLICYPVVIVIYFKEHIIYAYVLYIHIKFIFISLAVLCDLYVALCCARHMVVYKFCVCVYQHPTCSMSCVMMCSGATAPSLVASNIVYGLYQQPWLCILFRLCFSHSLHCHV